MFVLVKAQFYPGYPIKVPCKLQNCVEMKGTGSLSEGHYLKGKLSLPILLDALKFRDGERLLFL